MKDTHIKGIETFVNLLFAAAAFTTYASTSRYRYRYCAECTRLFNGCCLLQTIKAAFPPLSRSTGNAGVWVRLCLCVSRLPAVVTPLLLVVVAIGLQRIPGGKSAQKRGELFSRRVSSRIVSSLCPCVLDVLGWLCLGPWALFKQTTLTVFVVVILAQLLLLLLL